MVKGNKESGAKKAAIDWITKNEKKIIGVSDSVWKFAEIALTEYRTSKLCADTLEKNGFKVERGVAGMPTAFVATWGEGKPVIGIIGELDALPSLSQKAVPYKEPFVDGGPGHGCGHNQYVTSAVAGGIATKRAMEKAGIKGTIKVFGTPAEETLVGKIFMVRDGYFSGLDACLGMHTWTENGVSLGTGNALNSFKVEFFGQASHAGSMPHLGRSALDAVELMDMGVNFLREHVVQEARLHYIIEDGGSAPNVVPPYARSWHYVRAPLREQVEQIYNRVLKIADAADLMANTTHKITFLTGCYQRLTNLTLAKHIVKNMREIGAPTYTKEEYEFAKALGSTIPREQKISELRRADISDWEKLVDAGINSNIYDPSGDPKKGGGGSSDIADVSWNMPTAEFKTAGFIIAAPSHSWYRTATSGMSIGHKAILFAAKTHATTALDLLTDSVLLKEVQDEFKASIKGFTYKSPLPPDLKPPLPIK